MSILEAFLRLVVFVVFGIPLIALLALAVYAAMMMIMYGVG